MSKQWILQIFLWQPHGLALELIRCRFILIFPVIPTWQLDSAKCLVFIFRKTSITHICQKALQNSGEDGTLRFPPGLKATSIFRWAAAGKSYKRTIFNIAVVWFLTGVWHGASWNFILWGSLYGVLIILEKLITTALKNHGKQDILNKIPSVIKRIYAIVLVMLGWVLFDTKTIHQAFSYMGRMFHFGGSFYDSYTIYLLVNFGLLFVIAIIGSTDLPKRMAARIGKKLPAITNYGSVALMAVLLLLSTAYLVNASYNPFLYFNF